MTAAVLFLVVLLPLLLVLLPRGIDGYACTPIPNGYVTGGLNGNCEFNCNMGF